MNKLSCEVVRDLLPLYYDEVCSANTKEAVEAHLGTCEMCKAALHKLQLSSSLPFELIAKNKLESTGLANFKAYWRRSKKVSFVKGLLLATAVIGALYLGYVGLFQWNINEVPASVIEVTQVSRLRDGRIAYHVKMNDGYRVNQVNYTLEDDGNFYMTPVRPVIQSKKFAEISLGNIYNFVDLGQLNANRKDPKITIKAIYYGPRDNPTLLWKEGMELPSASDVVEAQYANWD
ncbi:zf-HC2 domain-containing protein [Paenibacillus sp. F6_3S_P_1C]|uniref:Zf-HC2 domain-containing protein n=1 Tax=Paenibacillus vandeheii TaxID=3035917 RepID=A0ABT8J3V1_9BACL|nr:zf-HC2 domain-containing protein [Paenibacillus vandeheii]MDN4599763.1 zf-HC2 domain-containing protein [Paenibacillus vandeheii]